jgi:autotransporter-associated beta strand protein
VFFGNAYNVTTFRLGGITRTATDLMVEVIAGGSSPASLAWRGGYSGASNVWSVSNAVDASNWTVGGTVQAGVPGVSTTVTFSDSTLLTAPTATVLGADVSVNGLVMSDTVNGLGLLADGHVLSVGTGGIFIAAGAQAVTIAPNIILSGSQTWQNDSGNTFTVSGDVAAMGNQLTVGGAGSTTISGNFSTSAGLMKSGAGVFTLSGIHSVSGDTVINGGTIHYQTGGAQVYSSAIRGSGNVMKSGPATLTLSGSNSYSGTTYFNDGVLLSANTSAFGSSTLTFGGGQWLVGGTGGTYSNTIANSGTSAVMVDVNGYTVNLAGDIQATNTCNPLIH